MEERKMPDNLLYSVMSFSEAQDLPKVCNHNFPPVGSDQVHPNALQANAA
jgi:hypothetical protein